MVTRVALICVLYPFLSSKSHKLTIREAIFISWAGLRGALAMALALIVEGSRSVDAPRSETGRLFFYVGGIATITLLLNAITAKPVLNSLQLIDDNSIEKQIVMGQVKRRLRKKLNKIIDEMAKDLSPEDIDEVRSSCTLLRLDTNDSAGNRAQESQKRLEERDSTASSTLQRPSFGFLSSFWSSFSSPFEVTSHKYGPCADDEEAAGNPGSGHSRASLLSANRSRSKSRALSSSSISDRFNNISRYLSVGHRGVGATIIPDILAYMRGVFLEIVRVKYWHEIEAGKLPRVSHSAQYLLYSVDVALDEVRIGLSDWDCIEKSITEIPWYLQVLTFLEDHLPMWLFFNVLKLHVPLGKLEARREKRAVYMLTSFIGAHEHAMSKIHGFVNGDEEETGVHGETPEDEMGQLLQLPEEIEVKRESRAVVEKIIL